MAGKSTRDILVEDLTYVDRAMCKKIPNTDEWWMNKSMRDMLLREIGRMDKERAKEAEENGCRN